MKNSALTRPTIAFAAALVLGLVSPIAPAAATSPEEPRYDDIDLCDLRPERCGEPPDYCEQHRQECVNWYCDRHPDECGPPEPRGCLPNEECERPDRIIWRDAE